MPAKVVKAEVSDAGYSWTSAMRIKTKLGIESAKEPGSKTSGWNWYLPTNASRTSTRARQETQETTEIECVSCVSCPDPEPKVEVQI
jgi:hypothetical protein